MTKLKVFIIFFFVLTDTYFSQTNNSAIKIIIHKKLTKDPITDSIFVSLNNSNMTNYRVIPNSEGETMLKQLEQGIYKVCISVKGYLTQCISDVRIGDAKTAYLTFAMTANEDIKTKKRRRNKK